MLIIIINLFYFLGTDLNISLIISIVKLINENVVINFLEYSLWKI